MSLPENKALVIRLIEEVWNRGNLGLIDELIAPDYIDHSAPPGWPAGPEGVKRAVLRNSAVFPDLHYPLEDVLAEGDKVITRWTWRGTHHRNGRNGRAGGILPAGTRVTATGMSIRRIAGGKIIELWVSSDTRSLVRQWRATRQ